MSMEYEVALNVGYQVSQKEFQRVFLKHYEGKFHLEPRFDAATGKEIEPKQIWDVKPRSVYEFDGLTEDGHTNRWGCHMASSDFIRGVCERFGCVGKRSAGQEGDEGGLRAIFSVPIPESKPFTYSVRMGIKYGTLSIASIPALLPQLETLRGRLKGVGLEVGEPEIIISHYCSY